jgi:hypothetical protein
VDLQPDQMIADDGSVPCSGAIAAAVHLAPHIIERFGGVRTGTVRRQLCVRSRKIGVGPD